jgi:predicted PurR-regulated permease PerM
VATDLVYVVVVPILSFFFLKDGRVMRDNVLDLLSEGPRRMLLEDLMADSNRLLAQYMRALVILCVAVFVAYSIGFTIMKMPFGILLAAMAAGLEFIPMIGPLAASLGILMVAALNGAPIVATLIFLVLYRMFQDYILSPHLMSAGVQLHPLMVLFGVFAGAEIAGVPGAFLSVPVLALVRIFYVRLKKERARSKLSTAVPTV